MFFPPVLAELRPLVGQLAEQVIVEHLARDRGGGRAAVAAVLHQQRHREPGVVRRRVRDEQRVIAVSLLHALLVVLLALLHGDHLRGAGLGGDGVARARDGASPFSSPSMSMPVREPKLNLTRWRWIASMPSSVASP